MLKFELIKALEKYSDDDVIVVGDYENGWTNIDEVKKEKGMFCLTQDYTRPFSDD